MQPITPSLLHSKLMDLYKGRIKEEPVQIPYARVSYIDFNQNGKRDLGEELIYNQKSEALLKHIVFRENDLLQLEKVSDLVFSENKRTKDYLNQIESFLVARRLLLATNTSPEKIDSYFPKMEKLFFNYLEYLKNNKLKPTTQSQDLDYLREFLWSNGNTRNEEFSFYFDKVLDNQLRYFEIKGVKVGNCAGLTSLYSSLSFRKGIPLEFVHITHKILNRNGQWEVQHHIFNKFGNKIIENTDPSGKNHYQFKANQVHSVRVLVLAMLKNTLNELHKQNNVSKMIEFFEKAISLDPEDDDLYNELATIILHNKKISDAIEWYHKGIILNPLNDNLLHNLGIAHLLKKDYPKAIKYINFAITLNSKEPEFHSTLGFAYEKSNQYQEAYNSYQKALYLNPKLESALNHMKRLRQKVKIVSRR